MVGKQIVLFRSTQGHNQSQFAALLGMDRSTLSRYESGKRKLPFYRVEQMAKVLDLPLSHFSTPGPEGFEISVKITAPKPPPTEPGEAGT